MGKELRENAPAARGSEEAGFTQFLTHKYTLLSMCIYLALGRGKLFCSIPRRIYHSPDQVPFVKIDVSP